MMKYQHGNSNVISFSTSFVFQIITASHGGQGLTFAIKPSGKLFDGDNGEYLGLLGEKNNGNFSNHVFAVEFDTAKARTLLNEDNGNHVGIDINDLRSNVSTKAGYYANDNNKTNLVLEDGQLIQAWIDYNSNTRNISVTIAPLSVPIALLSVPIPSKPLISLQIDLMPIFQEEIMHVGFTSSTSTSKRSCHYILAWSFSNEGVAPSIDLNSLPKFQHPLGRESNFTSKKSNVIITASSTATLVFVVILVGILLYVWKRGRLLNAIEDWELNQPHRIEYKDIYRATKGFNKTELLGSGGFGQVYKGIMPRTKEVVAIKRISNNTSQGMKEFAAEVLNLGRMRH